MFETMLNSRAVALTGMVLLHFVWQGALAGGVAYTLLLLTRNVRANVRYLAACGTLGVMAMLPLATWGVLASQPALVEGQEQAARMEVAHAPVTQVAAVEAEEMAEVEMAGTQAQVEAATPLLGERLIRWAQIAAPWFAYGWIVGVALLSMRLIGGVVILHRIRLRFTEPIATQWRKAADTLADCMGVRKDVAVLQSTRVDAPLLVGWVRPVILMPAGALVGLSVEQVELLLAHEFAHLRRYDHLVNLAQSVIETLLFYHPAVWYVSRRIRIEREHCCDDAVLALHGDAHAYATALTAMETFRLNWASVALSSQGGSLSSRIRRMLQVPAAQPSRGAAGVPVVLAAMIASALLLTAQAAGAVDAQSVLDTYSRQQNTIRGLTVYFSHKDVKDTNMQSRPDLTGEFDFFEEGWLSIDLTTKQSVYRNYQWGKFRNDGYPPAPRSRAAYFVRRWDGRRFAQFDCSYASDPKEPYPSENGTINRTPKGTKGWRDNPLMYLDDFLPGRQALGYGLVSPRLDTWLKKAQPRLWDAMEQVGSAQCYVIEADTPTGHIRAWFDADRDCSLVRYVFERGVGGLSLNGMSPPGSTHREEMNVVAFTQVGDLWLPSQVRLSSDAQIPNGDYYKHVRTISLGDYAINPDFEAQGDFELNDIPDDSLWCYQEKQGRKDPVYWWNGGDLTVAGDRSVRMEHGRPQGYMIPLWQPRR